jgi:hypothetical protein
MIKIYPVIFFILSISLTALCQSQKPSPGPPIGVRQEKPDKATQKNSATEEIQKYPDDLLSPIVKRESVRAENEKKDDAKPRNYVSANKDPVKFLIKYAQIIFDFFLVVFTGLLWNSTKKMWRATRSAAEAAQNTARSAVESTLIANDGNTISRDAMVAAQRPWISLDITIVGPLTYDSGKLGEREWHIPIQYQLRNMGKTPAINVSFSAKIVPLVFKNKSSPNTETDINKEFDDICWIANEMNKRNIGWGQVLFPAENMGGAFDAHGSTFDFNKISITNSGYQGEFVALACVTYGSTLGKDNHRTAKAFNLLKCIGDGIINLNGETITKDGLMVTPHFPNGSQAK